MSPDELSLRLGSDGRVTTRRVEFLAAKKFLASFTDEEKMVYKIAPAGRIFVENLRIVLEGARLR